MQIEDAGFDAELTLFIYSFSGSTLRTNQHE